MWVSYSLRKQIDGFCRGQIDEGETFSSSSKSYTPLSLLGKLEISGPEDSVCYGNMTLLYTPAGELQDKMAKDIQRFIQLYCDQKEKITSLDTKSIFKEIGTNESFESVKLLVTAVANEEEVISKYKQFKSSENIGGGGHLRKIIGGIVIKEINEDILKYTLRYGADFLEVNQELWGGRPI